MKSLSVPCNDVLWWHKHTHPYITYIIHTRGSSRTISFVHRDTFHPRILLSFHHLSLSLPLSVFLSFSLCLHSSRLFQTLNLLFISLCVSLLVRRHIFSLIVVTFTACRCLISYWRKTASRCNENPHRLANKMNVAFGWPNAVILDLVVQRILAHLPGRWCQIFSSAASCAPRVSLKGKKAPPRRIHRSAHVKCGHRRALHDVAKAMQTMNYHESLMCAFFASVTYTYIAEPSRAARASKERENPARVCTCSRKGWARANRKREKNKE